MTRHYRRFSEMGRITGFEPANDRFTAGCVDHFTISASRKIIAFFMKKRKEDN